MAVRTTYEAIAFLGVGLVLSACSSISTPDWLKPAPIMDTVRFESDPPGAEAKISNGQACRTPCALALSVNEPLTVTFTLEGYQPVSESIEPVVTTDLPQMRPNPVTALLTLVPPPPKPVKRPVKKKSRPKKKPVAIRPAAGEKPAAVPAVPPTREPTLPAPAQTPAPSR
jgi:PEGA domain